MMSQNKEQSWLDEAFDEGKAAEDMEQARNARRMGYLFLAILFSVIVLFAFACSGALDVMAIYNQ